MPGIKGGRVDGDYSAKFTGKDPLKQSSWEAAQARLKRKNSPGGLTPASQTVTPTSPNKAKQGRGMPSDRQMYQGGGGSRGLNPESGEFDKDKDGE